jgi:cytochrome c-type biogenesis protein CcmE
MRSRLRFIIAISLAVVLGAWLAWTSLGGSLETYAGPGELAASSDDTYRLNGRVAAGAPTDAAARAQSAEGLRFTVVDKEDPSQRVAVLYRGPQRLADHAVPLQVLRPARGHRSLSRRPPVAAR